MASPLDRRAPDPALRKCRSIQAAGRKSQYGVSAPVQIIPLAQPLGEFLGEVTPFLRVADRAGRRRDRQHRPPLRGAVDRHREALPWTLRMFCEIGLDHLGQLGRGLDFPGLGQIGTLRTRVNFDLRHRPLSLELSLGVSRRLCPRFGRHWVGFRFRLPEYLLGQADNFLVVFGHDKKSRH
jgi:hypothetical protein